MSAEPVVAVPTDVKTAASARDPRVVPGTVQLMTSKPIEIRGGPSWEPGMVASQLEERPWLVAAAILGLTAAMLLAGRRR